MAVTAIVNQKGGVGKTTLTLGLAAQLAADGQRVLIIDMDPQANATTGAGVWSPAGTVADALAVEVPGSMAKVVVPVGWPPELGQVEIAPSSPSLAQREHDLATDVIGGQDRLTVALAGVVDEYDSVLIDCPPSLGLLTVNSLFASDDVLIVAEPAAWSLDGVEQIMRNVDRIAQRRSGRPVVRAIVVNRLARTRDSAHWYSELLDSHRDRVAGPPIRSRAVVAEAAAHCLPLTAMTRTGAIEALAEFRLLVRNLGLVGHHARVDSTDARIPTMGNQFG